MSFLTLQNDLPFCLRTIEAETREALDIRGSTNITNLKLLLGTQRDNVAWPPTIQCAKAYIQETSRSILPISATKKGFDLNIIRTLQKDLGSLRKALTLLLWDDGSPWPITSQPKSISHQKAKCLINALSSLSRETYCSLQRKQRDGSMCRADIIHVNKGRGPGTINDVEQLTGSRNLSICFRKRSVSYVFS